MSGMVTRVARLHGLEDLRVEALPLTPPGPGELLVRIEANGVCATDARKYRVGVNDGEYPFNPGHEWVGWVEAVGEGVEGWEPGTRLYGDTYGGYADYATIPVEPGPWSCGPMRLDPDLAVERAVFIEPIADCFHALVDQGRLSAGEKVVVVGAGSMGLLMVGLAAHLGADVTAVEPQASRRSLARDFGAADTLEPTGWSQEVRDAGGADLVVLCIGDAGLIDASVAAAADGGRLVLFAGFGDQPKAPVDLNEVHYREISVIGTEWVGTPNRKRCQWYHEAAAIGAGKPLPLESLVTDRCSFDDLEEALVGRSRHLVLKTIFTPEGSA